MRDVYVIAVDTIKFGKHMDKSIKDLAMATASGCLKDAGLDKKDIQALWFSNAGWGERGQMTIRGQVALKGMGIEGIPITNVENACAGGSTALHHAWYGVAGGLYDITMAVGAEKLYFPNKNLVFAGFLGGIDIENVLAITKTLSVLLLRMKRRLRWNNLSSATRRPQMPPTKAVQKNLKQKNQNGKNTGTSSQRRLFWVKNSATILCGNWPN